MVGQFGLMVAILLAGLAPPDWPDAAHRALMVVGAGLAITGGAFAVWAGRELGRSFTTFPKPIPAGLVTSGPFAVVRHPVYSGGLVLFLGYSLVASIPSLVLTVGLGLLWAAKLGLEERLLVGAYDGYAAYRRRVRWRLIPLVY